MNHPIYKRDGYEFRTVEQSGGVSRAIGRKGKATIYDVTKHDGLWKARWSYATEQQAKEKFSELIE